MTDPLFTPLGLPRSGRQRYAAAMGLYRDGHISEAVLEVYRICSPLDGQDPVALLLAQKLPIPARASVSVSSVLHELLAAVDAHLATLKGPGVAEARAGLNTRRLTPVSPAIGPASLTLASQLDCLRRTRPTLAQTIGAANPYLDWSADQTDAQLIGENAPWVSKDFVLGLSLAGPPSATVSYFPLTPGLGIYATTRIVDRSR